MPIYYLPYFLPYCCTLCMVLSTYNFLLLFSCTVCLIFHPYFLLLSNNKWDHTINLMSLVSHKKSYLVCAELLNLRILRSIYLFSSSCLCPLLAVSVLYFEKKNRNRLREYSKIRQFDTYQIAFLMRNQGHKGRTTG